jgi:hypothetical protein
MVKARNVLGEENSSFPHRADIDGAWNATAKLYNEFADAYKGLGLELKLINL